GMHIHLNTQVAVKLLHTRLANEDVDDFRREAQMIALLIHPNIIRVLDFGVEGGNPYLVMDYAPDGTLRQRHPKGSIIALQLIVGYVKQIAEALQHAHELRLIHRDIKPENMLLGRNNEVLLSDFGIALAAQSSQYQNTQNVAGTISYMAPEQIQAHPRPASDQYSLGVVVYEWLSGNRPFQGSFTEIAVKHAMVPPAPLRQRLPQLPPAVEEVVMIALAKDPHQRFVNVRAFAHAFERATFQNASPHPSLLASSMPPPAPNISAGLSVPGTTIPYISDTDSTYLHNNGARHSHSTATPYPASGQPVLPESRSYTSEAQNGYSTGNIGMPGQAPGWGQGMPYGNVSFGPGMNQNGQYGNDPFIQKRAGNVGQVGENFRPHGAQAGDNGQKPLLSRRTVIAGIAGLVTVSSALTWAIASRLQGTATVTTSITEPGNTSSTTYTYPTPTAAVPPQLTYKGQQGYIWSVAWSPDGAYIVSGSADGTAHVWDCNNGKRVTAYRSHFTPAIDNDWAKKVTWAPDSKRIAIGFTDTTTQGVDINTEQELFSYTNSTAKEPIESVSWSPNGRYVAVGDFGNTVVIYDVASGQAITTYTDHSDSVYALAWSPDGKRIASGSSDGTARVWDALTGKTLLIYKKHSSDVESVSWSPDGSRVVSGGLDGTVQIWQAVGGYTLFTYTKHTGGIINSVGWSPDGAYIASGGNDVNTHIWEPKSGNLLKEFYTFPIFGLAWSPDSTRIVTGGYNKISQVWKVK
nr:protein kinase [Ktedonobacteraceae bacterium]